MNSTIKIDAGVFENVRKIVERIAGGNAWQEEASEIITLLETAQPQPEVTDAERKAALEALKEMPREDYGEDYEVKDWFENHYPAIRAALSAAPVQEVTVEQLLEIIDHPDICCPASTLDQLFPNGLRIVRGERDKS